MRTPEEPYLRLEAAIRRLSWAEGVALWWRGLQTIRRKYGTDLYLSSFKPGGMVEGESPTTEVTITVDP